MFGGRSDWLAGHAEPVEHSAWFAGDGVDGHTHRTSETQWVVGAGLEATWRIHIAGREPYDFHKEHFDVPGWVVKGSLQGSRRWHVRFGGGNGLLREVGVPCRVHPEDPYKVDFDWKAAYKLHEKAWDRQDEIEKRVTRKTEGRLGVAFRSLEFIRPKRFTEEEKAEIEAVAEEKAQHINYSTGEEGVRDEHTWARELKAEAARLANSGGIRVQAKVISRRKVPYTPFSTDIELDYVDPRDGRPRRVVHRFALMGMGTEKLTRVGKTTIVYLDPADPEKLALEASMGT